MYCTHRFLEQKDHHPLKEEPAPASEMFRAGPMPLTKRIIMNQFTNRLNNGFRERVQGIFVVHPHFESQCKYNVHTIRNQLLTKLKFG